MEVICTNETIAVNTELKANLESTTTNELNSSIVKFNNEMNKTFNTCNPYLKGNGLKSDVISN